MRLLKRAIGVIKDKNSILATRLSPQTKYRNPCLEIVVIKATSHEESRVDYKSVQLVFQWARSSPFYLKPFVWALSMRMEKTRSWAVALKGLMLIHGVFFLEIPALQRTGRMPFDLSEFEDGHLPQQKSWAFNAFIRTYFKYLDQRSVYVAEEVKKQSKNRGEKQSLMEDLENLQKLQGLIEMLLKLKPSNDGMSLRLILDAMECVIVDICDIYSKFCREISQVLLRIQDVEKKPEATMALNVLRKAAIQADDLSMYFELCRALAVPNASDCPKVERIPDEDIQELEKIINGKAIVEKKGEHRRLTTVITDKWVVFDDDQRVLTGNPFLDTYYDHLIVPYVPPHCQVLPDLISL